MPSAFHSPGLPEDLPEPRTIWAMASLAASFSAGIGDFWPESQRLEDDGLCMEDGGGNWWRMTRVGGGRFLLVGWDRTGDTDSPYRRPLDLFADAPGWLPWEWVERVEDRRSIGFAYWWDGAWGRAPYPDRLESDGLGIMVSPYSSVDEQVFHLVDFVDQVLPDHLDEDEVDAFPEQEALEGMIRPQAEALAAGPIDPEGFRAGVRGLGEAFDAEAALGFLDRAGLTPDERVPPEVGAGTGRPSARRGPWAISYQEWEDLVAPVVRAAGELDRPAVPETPRLRELAGWVRDMAEQHGGTATYTLLCLERMSSPRLVNAAGEWIDDRSEPFGAAFDLRRAEAHPERGAWFFLRVRATPEGVTVDRAYDHWPEWAGSFGIGSGAPVGDLRSEMARRSPEWRPDWVWLLGDEIPYDPPEDPFVPPA